MKAPAGTVCVLDVTVVPPPLRKQGPREEEWWESRGTQLPSQQVNAASWFAFASRLLAAQGGEDLFSH